jgi:hypothetical protein
MYTVKDWVWYFILVILICVDLIITIYFAVESKMVHTSLGYCFIDPLFDQESRFIILFILILASVAGLIILINYTLLCRLGLQMGAYISSEELQIDKNSIVEKSVAIVVLKSVSIMLGYTITLLPKLVNITYQVIYQREWNYKLDLVSDFLLALNAIPNLLTTILLNSVIREKFFNFKY